MITTTDQLGTVLELPGIPRRIVCLVPSITELLVDLGLESSVVGCTKFCVRPSHLRSRQKIVGGTKNVRLEKVTALSPDLIIANKEENTQEDVAFLAGQFRVWVSQVSTVAEANEMITSLGRLFAVEERAAAIITANRKALEQHKLPSPQKALYLIWRDPWMSVGGDTYISDVMREIGYENVVSDQLRYPTLSVEEIRALAPEQILLSSEPYPFKAEHLTEWLEILPQAKVALADGEFFSWYGSRLGNLAGLLS
ncbi:helical backbone metal receptor [Neolewinella persica]|uniref:helical backbone metal receptor n=1 Tax=Neolewinella persica TaxID=70998 RepID=UPI00036C21D0|nr:helical backbone metal receptor [Neolewinella persica]